ncbi:hypothetical protein CCZ01_08925 [Helicobacter monodelphidis]|uniref:hypothetical protein n=1 Tax=Helicobacter sp. 15-1451 TaxID=2004995 RepID=UPI000DCEBC16|nr:hypothetical protein [Helicobacter sp. 15-1451]RAX56621.1 hypothetical protein CCZ01_08925 [Helicobacter sp. 15-1451]
MAIKQSILVDQIIKVYLEHQEPIGSETLKLALNIKVSSATIRNHFKELVEAGILCQPHSSSGRIPTDSTLKEYWLSKFNPLPRLHFNRLESIKKAARGVGVFCAIRFFCPNFLEEVIPLEQRFLILRFSRGEVVLSFSQLLQIFLEECIGLELYEILRLTHQLKISHLALKLRHLNDELPFFSFGIDTLAELLEGQNEELFYSLSNGLILEEYAEGLYFDIVPKLSLAVVQNAKINNEDVRLVCIGTINRNYEKFYQKALA